MARLLRRTTRLAAWGSLGALVAYFFDPDNGRGRRTRTKDQLKSKVRRTGDQFDSQASYLQGKVEGVAHEASSPEGTPPDDDKTLADKIKSEVLGDDDFAGHQVVVDAAGGVVALRGEVQQEAQIQDLEARVRKLAGVKEVENLLHLPGTPAPNKQE